MNTTHKHITGILAVTIGLVLTLFLAACTPTENANLTAGNGETATQEDAGVSDATTNDSAEVEEGGGEKDLTFSYDLPEGWRWMEEGKLDAILDEKSKNGVAPYVKLSPTGFSEGTEEETKQYIKEIYDEAMEGCNYMLEQGEICDPQPSYQEMDVDGTMVYVTMDTSEYWGDDTWASSFAFEKNGRSIRFILYDQADQYQDELKTIVNSFTWEEK